MMRPFCHASDASRDGVAGDLRRCARFLWGAARHRARSDDVYISSYPRSGTTWLSLIVHLVHGGDTSFQHISQVVPWYERSLALGRARAEDFARIPSPRAFKSHLPYAWLPRGARYIYALRDGRDVLISYYELYRSQLGYTGTLDDFFRRFMRGTLQYRSWFRHVADFERAASEQVLIVRYEDMRRDPARALHEIARLCRRAIDPRRARDILDVTSFEAMKSFEHKFDHAMGERLELGRADILHEVPAGEFVRQGRVGAHRDRLTPTQLQAFDRLAAQTHTRHLRELRLAAFLH